MIAEPAANTRYSMFFRTGAVDARCVFVCPLGMHLIDRPRTIHGLGLEHRPGRERVGNKDHSQLWSQRCRA
jgi:hypothetical protein